MVASKEQAPLRLLIFGDSVAAGVGCPSNEDAFAGCVARALSSSTGRLVEWSVLGRSGFTAECMRRDLVPQIVPEVDSNTPPFDVCVVSVGVNAVLNLHSPRRYSDELGGLLNALRARLGLRCAILVCSMPPMELFPALSGLWPLNRLIGFYASAISRATIRACDAYGLAVCVTWDAVMPAKADLTPAAVEAMMAPDGFHPARGACEVMSGAIAEAALLELRSRPACGKSHVEREACHDRASAERESMALLGLCP